MNDLWGVQTTGRTEDGHETVHVFPSPTKVDADESARQINDWVSGVRERHPGVDISIEAVAVEWPYRAAAHAQELAALEALEELENH